MDICSTHHFVIVTPPTADLYPDDTQIKGSKMKIWIHVLVFAASSLTVFSQICRSEHYSAVLTATIETTESTNVIDDPELIFFKTYMKFRDSAIQHTTDDAIQFFNKSYGLDFSHITPDEKNVRFFQNARMSPFMLKPHIDYIVTDSYWIRTGSTRSSCYFIRFGGFVVNFSAEQTLYGSYGGSEGKLAGIGDSLGYGFHNIDICKQSPLIIQYQSRRPTRTEPDGSIIFISDIYNQVLGYGTARGIIDRYPDPNEPGKFRSSTHNVLTFPSQ